MMRPVTSSRVLRLRGAGEGEGEGEGDAAGYTIVQDGKGDFVIGGVDAAVGGGAEDLVNTKIGEEGRMGILCIDVGCQNTVAAMRLFILLNLVLLPLQLLPCCQAASPYRLNDSHIHEGFLACLQELTR